MRARAAPAPSPGRRRGRICGSEAGPPQQGRDRSRRCGGEIDVYTAPRLRELLIELVNIGHYQLVVNMEKVEFLDSTGLGVLVGGLKRVRAHDGSLDLVCTQERILKIFRITGLTKVFGIHDSVDEAIAARKSEK